MDTRILSHFPCAEYVYILLIYLGGFEFQKQPLEIKSCNKDWEKAVDTLIVWHFPSGEWVFVLLVHLFFPNLQNGHFGNQVLRLEEGSRHP